MKMLVRLSIVFSTLFGMMGGLSYAYPQWVQDCGFDFWNVSQYEREIQQGQRNCDELERMGTHIHNRMHVKNQLVGDYLEGRVSFRDLVLQFWSLNQQQPNVMHVIRVGYKGDSDLEKMCHNVMAYIRTRVSDNPSARDEWAQRTRHEMQELLADPELNAVP